MQTRICIVCGKEFEPNHHNTKCCSPVCRKKRKQERDKDCWYHEKTVIRMPKPNKELDKKEMQARKMGLSYGQMQALKYAQEHRLEV
ncbi:hypothetical protein [Aminipila sp.]|uniref:hypothetical protein n=1 Tax=Aminipila sp. TaxID=2060095 RepID=UPI00289C4CEA|nr:hypothetical protein [Aminipila sp.]